LRLRGNELTIDLPEYVYTQTDRILGILAHMVGRPPDPAAAA
jgi:hypothetical protein